MEIINRETGEVWSNVSMRDLPKIRKARKQGLSDRQATVAVLGQPDWTEAPLVPAADW